MFQENVNKIKKQKNYSTIGELVAFSKETTDYSEFEDGVFEYLEISGVDLGSNKYTTTTTEIKHAPSRAKMKTRVGDIAISTTRPHRGAIVEIKDDGIVASTGFAIVREISRELNFKWLLYSLMSRPILQQMLQRSSGGNYPAIVEDEIGKICIPLLSHPKQESMVSSIENALKSSEKVLQLASKNHSSFFEEVAQTFELNSNKRTNICYAVRLHELDGVIDAKRYASISKNVGECKIADICSILDEKVNVSRYREEIIDWIRIDDLPNQPLDIETVRTQPANEIEGSFFEVQEGDILVARLGPTILNQKIVMVRSTQRKTIASAEFLVLRCKLGYNPEAVMAVLKTAYYRDLMYSHARGSTPSRYRLNREDMLKLSFPDIREHQEQIGTEANHVREQVKSLRIQAEQEWQAAKAQFEKELLGE